MQSGSLVATNRDFLKLVELGLMAVKGIAPKRGLIFTCKEIIHFAGSVCIRVEECEVIWIMDNGVKMPGGEFKAEFWKELQAPGEVNVEEVVEEACCVLI